MIDLSFEQAVSREHHKCGQHPAAVIEPRHPEIGPAFFPYPGRVADQGFIERDRQAIGCAGGAGMKAHDRVHGQVPRGHHQCAERADPHDPCGALPLRDRMAFGEQVGNDIAGVEHHVPGQRDQHRDAAQNFRPEHIGVVIRPENQPRGFTDIFAGKGQSGAQHQQQQRAFVSQQNHRVGEREHRESGHQNRPWQSLDRQVEPAGLDPGIENPRDHRQGEDPHRIRNLRDLRRYTVVHG